MNGHPQKAETDLSFQMVVVRLVWLCPKYGQRIRMGTYEDDGLIAFMVL